MIKLTLSLFVLISSAFAQAPEITNFEAQMRTYGLKHCAALKSGITSFDTKLAATYYDAEFVFYNIGDYTHDSSWYDCAQLAEQVYRDQYVVPNKGNVPGYWNFSHGLTIDAQRGDLNSKSALFLLANNASYAPDTTPIEWTKDSTMSREVAYNIMTMLNAEKLGRIKTPRYTQIVEQGFGHIDQWFGMKNAKYIRPFMVSLTAHALIMNNDKTPDTRTLSALRLAADSMWTNLWIPASKSFKYTNVDTSKFPTTDPAYNTGGTEPAPDLNLLIAPVYAWIYKETGDTKYRDEADAIFAGGVSQAYLVNAKQFNQNYRWSFDYLRWRESGNACDVKLNLIRELLK